MSARGAWLWQRVGSGVLLALVFVLPLAVSPKGYDPAAAKAAALQAGVLALLLAWALKGLERGRWELPEAAQGLLAPAALLAAWTLARFLASPHKEAALPGFLHQAVGLAAYAAVLLEGGGSRDSSRLTGWLLASAWAAALYSLVFGGSTLVHPELLSVFLACAAPLALARLADPERPGLLKACDLALVLLCAFVPLAARSGWGVLSFALACGLSAAALASSLPSPLGARPAALAALLGLAALTAGLSLPAVQTELAESVASRSQVWSSALALASKRPWLGLGPGAFWAHASRGQEAGVIIEHAACEPLELAAELGLPGLALWLWLVGAWLARAWAARRSFLQQAAWPESLALAGLLPAAAALLAAGLFTPAARYAAPGWLFWPLAGLSGGLTLLAPRRGAVAVLPLPVGAEARRLLYAPAFFALGLLYLPASWLLSDFRHNRAVLAAREGRWADAEALAADAPYGSPLAAESRALLAAARLETGRPEEALAALAELEGLAPGYPFLRHRQGLAYAKLGDWRRAAESHEAQRALDPLYLPNLEGLYAAALAAGDPGAARRAAWTARAIDRDNPAHLFALARTYRQDRRLTLARRLELKAQSLKRR